MRLKLELCIICPIRLCCHSHTGPLNIKLKESLQQIALCSSTHLCGGRGWEDDNVRHFCLNSKEKRQKRAAEKRNSRPPKSPLEATSQLLKRKSFHSRVNFKALESLYTPEQDNTKKQRTEIDDGEAANGEKGSDEDAAMGGEDGFATQTNNDEDHYGYDYEYGDDGNGNVDDDYYGNEDGNYADGYDAGYDQWED
ncbi:hypothetical protein KFK09_024758 [Dendrobium nobile]|uniref:Brf1 TBP-binding domain-containing protein n=1 Tax=Dendrobium nobile TaxID=94219 RepID=A0A8T3AE02_DENNO|nr:hypothetical protein KFK09_024758 [Dendrobium nobile]